jgi:hypothetical protein
MANMNLAEKIHIVPLKTETQITSTTVMPHINMKLYDKVEFIYHMTAVAANDFTMTVTQSAATAGSTSTAIAARYRLTAAAGTDTMGDVTALASTGLAITTSHSTLTLIVDVESQDLTTDSKPYVGLTFTDGGSGDITGTLIALCWPKYPTATNASALT